MSIRNLASAGFWIVIASAVVIGQRSDQGAGSAPQTPVEGAVIRTYPGGSVLPSRRVWTRSESGGRELRTETVERPDSDGRLRPSEDTVTETIRKTPNVTRSKRDVFRYSGPGQRTLQETTESEQEILPDGSSRTEQSTWTLDANGRLGLTSREIEQTKSIAPDLKQTDTAVFRRSTDNALQESERIQQTERQVGPDFVRTETTRSVRDMNGRFERTEERRLEVRTTGPSQHVEEETVRRLDADGKLSLSERSVTRRSTANGQEQIVKETYSKNIDGALMRSDNRIELSQRVRRTTAATPDGGGQTIEEVEARNSASPYEPIRMIQRTVETTRRISDERWQTERQVFVLDVNGRWVLARSETGEQKER